MAVFTQTTRVRRVFIALVIAGVLIGGAYLLGNPSLFAPSAANAESTQALLQAYSQKKGPDGLPLWEEQLISTASSTAWQSATSTSADDTPAPAPTAAAGTLTDTFAQQLFAQYMTQEASNNPSDSDIDSFAANQFQQLVQNHTQQNIYSASNVSVAGTGALALTVYATEVSKAISAHTVHTQKSELDYFSDAVEKNQTGELVQVAEIGAAYTGLAPALMQIQVPAEAEPAHLEIANAAARLGEDIGDMSAMETDPLRAYLGLSAYENDAASLGQGFSDMAAVFQKDNVTLTSSDSGYDLYALSFSAASIQAEASTSP